MLKLCGALLLMAGAAGLGFGAAAQLEARVTGLRAMVGALAQMERELSFNLTPMPELLDRLAREAQPPAALFFARCRAGMGRLGEQSMGALWREALAEESGLLLTHEEQQTLCALGDVLGRYDGDGQRAALQNTMEEMGRFLAGAQRERDRLGRVYGVLGLGAGAMLVILLL